MLIIPNYPNSPPIPIYIHIATFQHIWPALPSSLPAKEQLESKMGAT